MDTVVEHSENTTVGDQIKIVYDLEKYIFEKIYSTPPFNFNKSIRMAVDFEMLKTIIYALHDEGLFKESNEDRIKRLCKDPVQVPIPCKKGDNKVEKLDFEYLPKHYHEIISDIKSYRSAIEYKSLLQQYSKHRDCYVVELLPESFQNTIDKIQLSYLSQEPDEIKEKAYLDFVEEFIKKYEYDHVLLWNALNFSRQDQNTLKELSFLSFRFIGPLKNKFAIRQHNSKIQFLKPKKIILFEQLMEYLDKKATAYVREILMQMYDRKENIYIKQQGNIDKLLRTYIKKYQTKILNRKQQVKIIAKIKTKFTPQIIQILEDKQDKKHQQLNFKMQLQKHIVRNLTNSSTGTISSEPVYDPYLFTPTASIHDTDTLTELKTKATRNKSAKKQKGFQTQEHPTTQPKRNFIGDTKRMLKKNHEIYQSLKNS